MPEDERVESPDVRGQGRDAAERWLTRRLRHGRVPPRLLRLRPPGVHGAEDQRNIPAVIEILYCTIASLNHGDIDCNYESLSVLINCHSSIKMFTICRTLKKNWDCFLWSTPKRVNHV